MLYGMWIKLIYFFVFPSAGQVHVFHALLQDFAQTGDLLPSAVGSIPESRVCHIQTHPQ